MTQTTDRTRILASGTAVTAFAFYGASVTTPGCPDFDPFLLDREQATILTLAHVRQFIHHDLNVVEWDENRESLVAHGPEWEWSITWTTAAGLER